MNKTKKAKGYAVAGLLAVLGFGSFAAAQQGLSPVAQLTELAKASGESFGKALDYLSLGDDESFGAVAFDEVRPGRLLTTQNVQVTGDIVAEKGYSLGTLSATSTFSDGYTKRLVTVDLDATSSAVVINPEDETIWVYDATLRVQTATTSNIAYQMGTTTSVGVEQALTCGATGVCAAATAGHASILDTGAEAVPTALDTFFKADYQGTDTRDGSGTRFVVPVLDDEYLSCNASTTPAANNEVGGQAVQCQFWYYVIED